MNKNAIIGTGLSGRGYLNRLLYLSKGETVFLDRDENLIRQLRKEPSYTIRFGSGRGPLKVDNYITYTMTDEHAIANVAQTERVFISIGADHVAELLPFLQTTLQERDRRSLDILIAENGIQPSSPLTVLRSDSWIHLNEAVIFCTTLGQHDSLDTFGGNLGHLPYNNVTLGHELPLYGFIQETHFSDLLECKIHTYNCISACIAYLGYEKGYTDYAEATSGIEITEKIKRIAEVTNRCIAIVYNVSIQGQTASSEMAVWKFQNRSIKNTVTHNIRNVRRKLKPEERIRKPLSLMQEQGGYSKELLEVLATALQYGMKTGELSRDWGKLVDLYTQGMCKEWKQVLHHCKWSGYEASTIHMKAAGSLERKV